MRQAEILAPAGSRESLTAAVRSGADAVYLGGKALNARRAAANFNDDSLKDAVSFCHARGVKVYLTLNTIVTDRELNEMADSVRVACESGVDALIVQDLSVAAYVRHTAPSMEIHASTQMSVHNAEGARELEKLGFSRVVLARELSMEEISEIRQKTSLGLEAFVHGALCMSVSGQCYFSAILGGRSGNRGLCAQPCRLPFSVNGREYCLSLKDLSLIDKIPGLLGAGVTSLKIEGRMKRPEYVSAAVSAVKQAISGEPPDMGLLKSIFSRDGFTSGYFDGNLGLGMFGRRRHEDVASASPALLSGIAASYKNEAPLVPVDFTLTVKRDSQSLLAAADRDGNAVTVTGGTPQIAETSPTTYDKAAAALQKTGGTPFFASDIRCDIDDGLILPASGLNSLRREALGALLKIRETPSPREFAESPDLLRFERHRAAEPRFRARLGFARQFTTELADACESVIIPADAIDGLDKDILSRYAGKIFVEASGIIFGQKQALRLRSMLDKAKQAGISHAVAGNLGSIGLLREHGFNIHGDYSLNISNSMALSEYERLGLADATVSFELTSGQIAALGGALPRGIIVYGNLPLMTVRNCPVGNCDRCESPVLDDRLGNKFPVTCNFGAVKILNCVPLFLADKLEKFKSVDFMTLYFTNETRERCAEILRSYKDRETFDSAKTRGLYFRGVE